MPVPDLPAVLVPLALVWGLAVVTPGPNFIAILNSAVAGGRSAAVMTAAGTLAGTALWALAGIFGLKALFVLMPWTAMAIKLAGAVYLVWAGIAAWRGAAQAAGPVEASGRARRRAFARGLLTVLANPKTAAFAASLFAVAVPAGAPHAYALAALATICGVSAAWYFTLALTGASRPVARLFARARGALMRLAGAIFIGFGLRLAVER